MPKIIKSKTNKAMKGDTNMPSVLLNKLFNEQHESPTHAIILARVSSAEQREGKSLAAQEISARAYCERKKMEVEKVFSFTESSTRGERKQFREMMNYVISSPHPIAIVADTLDRFQRSFKESLEYKSMLASGKFELHFVSNNMIINKCSHSSEMMMYDMGVMAAKSYVDQLIENVTRGFAQKIREHEYPFKAPVGYKNVNIDGKNTIIQDRGTAPIVRKLFIDYSTGNYPLKAAARDFCNKGVKSIHGTPFSVSSVHRILENPFYYGQMKIQGHLFPHKYEPIITEDLFRRCERVRKGLSSHPFDYATKPFIFRGILRCKKCGHVITCYDKNKKIVGTGEVHNYHYLRCSGLINKRGCTEKQVNEKDIENQLIESLEKLHIDQRLLDPILDTLNKESNEEIKANTAIITRLRQRLGEIDKTRSILFDREAAGSVSSDFVNTKLKELKQEETTIRSQLNNQKENNREQVVWTVQKLLKLASQAAELYASSNVKQKNALIRSIYSNCLLGNKKLTLTTRKPFQLILEGLEDIKWSGRRDSNPRPHGPEPCALPTALRPVKRF